MAVTPLKHCSSLVAQGRPGGLWSRAAISVCAVGVSGFAALPLATLADHFCPLRLYLMFWHNPCISRLASLPTELLSRGLATERFLDEQLPIIQCEALPKKDRKQR